jgi:hypothetical protein
LAVPNGDGTLVGNGHDVRHRAIALGFEARQNLQQQPQPVRLLAHHLGLEKDVGRGCGILSRDADLAKQGFANGACLIGGYKDCPAAHVLPRSDSQASAGIRIMA